MNPWLQRKTYRCPACGATYLHDRAHAHGAYDCPARPTGRQDSNRSDDRRMGELRITVDHEAHEVRLIGADGRYEARLTWVAAANLASLLNEASKCQRSSNNPQVWSLNFPHPPN
ncbi:hypothetical protein DNFV4_02823 [Nitrospira tepida]|uniref:Uncharacterized protein n=1 Tax=Nitrospira tepida TaxID=2973512 RepID=A0AA86N0B2_9BACT|nr:hypothetical protein [Nitrospira tepida]CAI4032393.1 hypothetical protein DNFV4_02823 [Nitrospira tepida]